MKAEVRRRAGHYEILGETLAKFEFFQQGWNPYRRFLDVDKVDLILRRSQAGIPCYREVQVKFGKLFKVGPAWERRLFDVTTWRFSAMMSSTVQERTCSLPTLCQRTTNIAATSSSSRFESSRHSFVPRPQRAGNDGSASRVGSIRREPGCFGGRATNSLTYVTRRALTFQIIDGALTCSNLAAPNPRLQRTPSVSPPSPLSRRPLGLLVGLPACICLEYTSRRGARPSQGLYGVRLGRWESREELGTPSGTVLGGRGNLL